MRIATWNLERPNAQQLEKIEALQACMRMIDADVWILTETNSCVSPGSEYRCVESPQLTGPERYAAGENRTSIWSRLPMRQSIQTHDPETAVCAEIKDGNWPFLIYGTIIPYQHAGTKYPYRFEGGEVAGRKSWELHYESIANHGADWQRLRGKFPAHHLVVAGDLNQSRGGRHVYGTIKGRGLLGEALAEAKMTCVTEGVIEPVEKEEQFNPVIDHICLDRELSSRVTAVRGWLPMNSKRGKPYSDHTGVFVDLTIR